MSRLIQGACIALAGLFLLVLFAAPAGANGRVRVNTTATTATSTNQSIGLLTVVGQIPIGARVLSMRMGISSAGAVSMPLGAVAFTGATYIGNVATITQTSAWSGQFVALLSADGLSGTGVLLRITVPIDGLRFRSATEDFYLGGTLSSLSTITPTSLGRLFTLGSLNFVNAGLNALSLSVTRVARTAIGVAIGNRAGEAGLYVSWPGIVMAVI